jgi:hypothetical protein
MFSSPQSDAFRMDFEWFLAGCRVVEIRLFTIFMEPRK